MQEKFYGILYGEKFSKNEQKAYALSHRLLCGTDLLGAAVSFETLSEFIKLKEFDGLIISPEFGKAVMPLISKTSAAARACGAVDVIVKQPDGKLYGDNTAIPAFSYLLSRIYDEPIIGKCIILGASSDATAVKYVLSHRSGQIGEIVTVTEKGRNNFENISQHADATMLINTLPLDELPFSLSSLPMLDTVIDLTFSPINTPLTKAARDAGINAVNGIPMVCARVKAANELFFGIGTSDEDILRPVEAALISSFMTIVLISEDESLAKTVAPMLSEAIGKKAYDISSVIEQLYRKSIAEIKSLSGPKSNEFDRSLRVAVKWASARSECIICAPADIADTPAYRDQLASNGVIIGIVKPEETAEALEAFCDILVQIPDADHAEIAVEAIRAELQI